MFPYDFRDERMMQQLKTISQRVLHVFPELRAEMGVITHNLLNKVSQLIGQSSIGQLVGWSVDQSVSWLGARSSGSSFSQSFI